MYCGIDQPWGARAVTSDLWLSCTDTKDKVSGFYYEPKCVQRKKKWQSIYLQISTGFKYKLVGKSDWFCCEWGVGEFGPFRWLIFLHYDVLDVYTMWYKDFVWACHELNCGVRGLNWTTSILFIFFFNEFGHFLFVCLFVCLFYLRMYSAESTVKSSFRPAFLFQNCSSLSSSLHWLQCTKYLRCLKTLYVFYRL